MFAALTGIPTYTSSIAFMNIFTNNKMRYDISLVDLSL